MSKPHVSKTWLYFFSAIGRRVLAAEDRRIRRKAARVGLRAEKRKSRGWTLSCGWSGTIVFGPDEDEPTIEARLDTLIARQEAAR